MTAPKQDKTADPEAVIAALRAKLNAALADKAEMEDALAARSTELATRNTEYDERIEYQSATSDVLKAMSRSPGDPQPVFDLIVRRARDLCDAYGVTVYEFDGKLVYYRVATGVSDDPQVRKTFAALYPMPPTPDLFPHRAILERKVIRIDDLKSEPGLNPIYQTFAVGSAVAVPLLRGEVAIGALGMGSRERGGFTDSQIELLKTFADQAVIAIENARLFNETQEALERQTATAEVLQVINASPGDLQPVFETILEKAHSLCAVAHGTLQLYDGKKFHSVASRGLSEALAAHLRQGVVPGPNTPHRRLLEGARFAQVTNWAEIDHPLARTCLDAGIRTTLYIPLRREGKLLGYIAASRQEVRPFTEKEIALLESFAVQAVIAMENARLLGELRERTADLARSVDELTATGDVLKIISRSSVDLETVLETLVETVARLCRADQVYMFHLRHDLWHLIADYGLSIEAREFFKTNPFTPGRGSTSGRAAMELRAVSITDVLQDPEYTLSEGQAIAGYRSTLGVPLLRENTLIGVFSITRTRVEPFASKAIELATSFADQAVIAIENARLFEELRDRQAELRVTFDNMGDGVVMFGADTRLVAWNRNFQTILDLPDAFLAQRPSYADYFRYLVDRGEYSADLEAALSRANENPRQELRIERTRPDGRVIEARRNAVPDGGFVLIYADITERKRAEEAIRLARDAAETALCDLQTAQDRLVQTEKLASLGQLTAGIAHEIKNPLNFVNNFSALSAELTDELNDTLKAAPLNDKLHEEVSELTQMLKSNLEKVVQHGKRADSIVKNMLLHSREGSREQRPADINTLVDESLNLAYHGARAEKSGFEITLQRDFDANAGTVELFPQEISRALLNLLSNGFYAATKRKAENGGAKVEPTVLATTKNLGSSVEIRIRDNGAGIPPEVREKMFNPFFTTKPTGEGTGLGLSMTHDIVVKQHGGRIDVETKLGEFTEFIITLPRNNRTAPG